MVVSVVIIKKLYGLENNIKGFSRVFCLFMEVFISQHTKVYN